MPQVNSVCDGLPIYTPEENCHEGCPMLNKIRNVLLDRGIAAAIRWTFRDKHGNPVNISACFCSSEESISIDQSLSLVTCIDSGVIKVRFADCMGQCVFEQDGELIDAATGTVQFAVPEHIYDNSGIYQMSIGVVDSTTDKPVFIEKALLLVEESQWGNLNQANSPPTISEIQIALNDHAAENELLGETEFDMADITHALVAPIRQWNESPPPIAYFNCINFPYRYHWRQAVIGELLSSAVHKYMRNNLNMNHGGVQGNFKDKYKEYLQMVMLYKQEWKEFVEEKKMSINAQQGIASLGSDYGW